MKKRTKRKIKKIINKHIFLILFLGLFSSIFLLGTAYSLLQTNLNITGTSQIGNSIISDGGVCSSTISVDKIISYDFTTKKTITITLTNDSSSSMKDIILKYNLDGTDTTVISAQGGEISQKDNDILIKIYEWNISNQTGSSLIKPGEKITLELQVDGDVTESTIKERLSLAFCGQDNSGNDETTKITSGNIEMNLNYLEKELPLTIEVTEFAQWDNIYTVKITATNIYDESISSFRFISSYDSFLTYNSVIPWTSSIEENNDNKVINGSYTFSPPLAPGEKYEFYLILNSNSTDKQQTCNEYGCYENGYAQKEITIYSLAAGIFS